jgi:gliding motility-associated-like protein
LPLHGNPGLSFARIEILHGAHTIKSANGFTAYVYGFGNARGYAYSVGSNAIDLTGYIVVNGVDILSNDSLNAKSYCKDDTLHFKLNVNYQYDSVRWNLGNGTIAALKADTISSLYTIPGIYPVSAIVKLAFANCEGSLYDTIDGYLNIIEIKDTLRDTTCYGYYNENGFSFQATNDTVVSLQTTSWMGCDSLVTIYLHVLENPFIEDTVIACQNSSTSWRNKQLPTDSTGIFTFWDSLKTVYFGCDSVYKLTFIVKPVYLFNDTMAVCQYAVDNWHNVALPTSDTGIFTVESNLQTVDCACDSTYKLHLTVKPVYLFDDTVTVCWNETFFWRNKQLLTSVSGIFTLGDTLVATNSCDSIYRLRLVVLPRYFFEDTLIVCQNATASWHDTVLSADVVGTYIFWDSLISLRYNCDSVYKLTFIVMPIYFFNERMTVCQYSFINWHTEILPTSDVGTFTVWSNLHTVEHGCDSIYELYLTVKPVYLFAETMTVCWNAAAVWRGRQLQTSISGIITVLDSLTSVDGCDSIYKLTLNVLPSYFFTDTLMVCHQSTANWHGIVLPTSVIGTFIFWDSLKTVQYNCDSIYKLILIVQPIPELTTILTDDTLCPRTQTSPIDFTGTATDYEWIAGGDDIGLPSQLQTDDFGRYTVRNNTSSMLSATIAVTPKSDYGRVVCTGLAGTFTLVVYPDIKVHATANDSFFCEGGTAVFETLNHDVLHDIQWTGADNFSSLIYNPSIENVSFRHSGMYIVNALSQYGCDAVADTVFISVIADVILDLEDTIFLCNAQALLYAHTMYADAYLWSTGDTTANITVSKSGKYWIKATNLRCQAVDTAYVEEIEIPLFEIQTNGDFCLEGNMELFVTVGLENISYNWSTGDTADHTIIYRNGVYGVAVSFRRCTTLTNVNIDCPCDLWIPNTFTPNGDSLNDDFLPIPQAILHSFSMFIYDRWGDLIYKTDTYLPWNGTANGKYAMTGVYAYLIYYSCSSNPDKTYKRQGKISLIR